MSEYMSPISTPLTSSTSVKSHSNMDVLDRDARAHGCALAVLVADLGGDLGFRSAVVKRVDHRRVFLGDHPPPQLPRARNLGVVGVEILRQQEKPPHARRVRQPLVALLDFAADQAPDLRLLRQILVSAV